VLSPYGHYTFWLKLKIHFWALFFFKYCKISLPFLIEKDELTVLFLNYTGFSSKHGRVRVLWGFVINFILIYFILTYFKILTVVRMRDPCNTFDGMRAWSQYRIIGHREKYILPVPSIDNVCQPVAYSATEPFLPPFTTLSFSSVLLS